LKKRIIIALSIIALAAFLTGNAFAWSDMIMGKPKIIVKQDKGVFYWLDKDGFHLRFTAPQKTVFKGGIITEVKNKITGKHGFKKGDSMTRYMWPCYLRGGEIKEPGAFFSRLKSHKDPVSKRIWNLLEKKERASLNKVGTKDLKKEDTIAILNGINKIIRKKSLYDAGALKKVKLTPEAQGLIKKGVNKLGNKRMERLNRLIIETAYPDLIKKDTRETVEFTFVVNKNIKGFDFKTKSPYIEFLPCTMNGKLVKRQSFKAGKKKQDLEHTPFKIFDIGNPNVKMPFPH